MNDDLNKEMKGFREEIAESLGHTQKDENIRNHRAFLGSKPAKKILILGGAGILLLIVLIALFSGGDKKLSTEDLTSIRVRLDILEKRLTRLERVELRIASLEKQEKGLQHSIVEMDRSGRYLTQQLGKLTQRLDSLKKGMAPVAAKTGVSTAIQRKPLSPGKKRFHEVRPGETLFRIAQQYSISVDELCRLNNITPNRVIQPGQKLLVTSGSPQ